MERDRKSIFERKKCMCEVIKVERNLVDLGSWKKVRVSIRRKIVERVM